MARFQIRPSTVSGHLVIPASKSHSLRALLFAALAKGASTLEGILASPDCASMIDAVRLIGAKVAVEGQQFSIQGTGGVIHTPDDVIHCGNSGIVLRFLGALAALQNGYAILTGDASIRHNRPVKPLLSALEQLGAFAVSSRQDDYAPLIIKGPLLHKNATLNGADSQPVSGLLIAGALAPHSIALTVTHAGELPWIDLTLYWLDKLGISYRNEQYMRYELQGNATIAPFHLAVPGDFSSAAFPIAAALITHSEVSLQGLDPKDPQGDKHLIDVLIQMGAEIEWKGTHLHVRKSKRLRGIEIDVNPIIDAVPILAVLGCYAEGTTRLYNAAIARNKECDRLHCIAVELSNMGAVIEEHADSLVIHSSPLKGARLDTYHDHRMVMALSVAALGASGESTIEGVECVAKTYPSFYSDFRALGADIQRHD